MFSTETWDFVKFMFAVWFMFVAMLSVISVPIAYFEGSAKSAYLRQTSGVELPWYQAAFIKTSEMHTVVKVDE